MKVHTEWRTTTVDPVGLKNHWGKPRLIGEHPQKVCLNRSRLKKAQAEWVTLETWAGGGGGLPRIDEILGQTDVGRRPCDGYLAF